MNDTNEPLAEVTPPALPSEEVQSEAPRTDLTLFTEKIEALKSQIASVIVGQEHTVDLVLTAILANGHVLIEGAYIWVTLGRDSIPLLTAGRNAAAVRTAVRFINSIYVITTINSGFHIPVDDNPAAMRAYPNPLLEFQSFIR